MGSLPTGTVTFLFTDVEGSTRVLQQLGDRYADILDVTGGSSVQPFFSRRGDSCSASV